MLGKGPLYLHVSSLEALCAGMMVMARMAPHRMTLSQVIFFVTAGTSIAAGKPTTYTEVKEMLGEEINRSLAQTYRVLFEPSRVYPKALEWMTRETNPADNRQKFFQLTPQGRRVLDEILKAMGDN